MQLLFQTTVSKHWRLELGFLMQILVTNYRRLNLTIVILQNTDYSTLYRFNCDVETWRPAQSQMLMMSSCNCCCCLLLLYVVADCCRAADTALAGRRRWDSPLLTVTAAARSRARCYRLTLLSASRPSEI